MIDRIAYFLVCLVHEIELCLRQLFPLFYVKKGRDYKHLFILGIHIGIRQ